MSLLNMPLASGRDRRRGYRSVGAAVLAAAACAALAPSTSAGIAAGSPGFSLHVDSGAAPLIAGDRVGTFTRAVQAFGRPATMSRVTHQAACRAAWPRIGLRITFSTARPGMCVGTTLGSWLQVAALTARWHTDGGLRVGDAATRLHALYPQARRLDFVGPGIWDLEEGGPLCDGGLPLVVAARVAAGVVRSLTILHIPACG